MAENAPVKRARRLRKEANLPEQKAWAALRQFRRHGYPVRRQHPIGPYIVDFVIVSARLVIEIDGGVHRLEEVAARDRARDQYLMENGWRVLRFEASEALSADHLIARISDQLGL